MAATSAIEWTDATWAHRVPPCSAIATIAPAYSTSSAIRGNHQRQPNLGKVTHRPDVRPSAHGAMSRRLVKLDHAGVRVRPFEDHPGTPKPRVGAFHDHDAISHVHLAHRLAEFPQSGACGYSLVAPLRRRGRVLHGIQRGDVILRGVRNPGEDIQIIQADRHHPRRCGDRTLRQTLTLGCEAVAEASGDLSSARHLDPLLDRVGDVLASVVVLIDRVGARAMLDRLLAALHARARNRRLLQPCLLANEASVDHPFVDDRLREEHGALTRTRCTLVGAVVRVQVAGVSAYAQLPTNGARFSSLFGHQGSFLVSRRGALQSRPGSLLDALSVAHPGHLSGYPFITDLANIGYDAEWNVVSAASAGAPHLRKRLFIVAYPSCERLEGIYPQSGRVYLQSTADSLWREWGSEPSVDRVANGVRGRMVRDQLRALGNAVVPQVAEAVGRMILAAA